MRRIGPKQIGTQIARLWCFHCKSSSFFMRIPKTVIRTVMIGMINCGLIMPLTSCTERDRRSGIWHFKTPRPLVQRKDGHTASEVYDPTANGSATITGRQIFRSGNCKIPTIQRHHGRPDEEPIVFMERHSALQSKGLAVGVE